MSLQLKPLHPLFAAEASGIDLTKPVDAAAVRAVDDAMDKYAVVVFRGQPLTEEQQVAFAGSFGTLDSGLKKLYPGSPSRFRHEETIDISNVRLDGGLHAASDRKTISNLANQLWHSDSSFERPAGKYSMLHSVVAPAKGGETEFADLRAAYDALPDDLKAEIKDCTACTRRCIRASGWATSLRRRSSQRCRRCGGRWSARMRARSAGCSGSARTRRTSSKRRSPKDACCCSNCSSTPRSANSSTGTNGAWATL